MADRRRTVPESATNGARKRRGTPPEARARAALRFAVSVLSKLARPNRDRERGK